MRSTRDTEIFAFDLATTTGYAHGVPGAIPTCGSVCFASGAGASHNAIFANALTWFSQFIKADTKPRSIILEAMLPPQALKGETQRKTRDLLAGLHGIARAVGHCRGIYEIADVSALTVRKHFCGNQRASKQDVVERCRLVGWNVPNEDAADAAACWHFACALVRPEVGVEVSPLFYGKRPMRISA